MLTKKTYKERFFDLVDNIQKRSGEKNAAKLTKDVTAAVEKVRSAHYPGSGTIL